MNHRTNHGPWIFLVLLTLGLLFGCTVPFGRSSLPYEPTGQIVPQKTVTYVGGPRVNHAIHAENELECTDCHAMSEETGELLSPTREGCLDCHEDPEEGEEPEEGEPVITGVFFDKEGKPLWNQGLQEYDDYVHFSHKVHAKAGDCTTCHKNLEAGERGRPVQKLYTMAQCMECHTEAKANNACAVCHESIDENTMPRSHGRGWQEGHGYAANRLRMTEIQHDCSLCHNEPNYCNDCHQVTQPKSHYQLWEKRHGQAVRAAGGDMPRRCMLCHDQRTFCESCHLDEPPRNHTALFRTRTHGVMAAIDRRNCETCHKIDFCQRCHEDTAPRSHRGMFSRRRNTHCVQCHFPISSNDRCRVCHTTNPTHSTAPAQPANHVPGRNCRLCHNQAGTGARPLVHVDNGQNCEFCHK
ncbi:MAG: cytochrome c3 family protein [Planctomycetota bacterium]|nr:cytochrome c3 family protein [Planctomycetota bacterium]